MSAKQHDWFVFSTAIRDVVLMLECQVTGAFGIVRKPTKEEWSEAFYASSNPYRWEGGDERVEIVHQDHPVWRVKEIMQHQSKPSNRNP